MIFVFQRWGMWKVALVKVLVIFVILWCDLRMIADAIFVLLISNCRLERRHNSFFHLFLVYSWGPFLPIECYITCLWSMDNDQTAGWSLLRWYFVRGSLPVWLNSPDVFTSSPPDGVGLRLSKVQLAQLLQEAARCGEDLEKKNVSFQWRWWFVAKTISNSKGCKMIPFWPAHFQVGKLKLPCYSKQMYEYVLDKCIHMLFQNL